MFGSESLNEWTVGHVISLPPWGTHVMLFLNIFRVAAIKTDSWINNLINRRKKKKIRPDYTITQQQVMLQLKLIKNKKLTVTV